MQQFQVPQFITIEDRIIGPLTLKQFLYLLGAVGAAVVGWTFLHIVLFVIFVLPIAGLFTAMAFLKINERPLPTVLFAAINYYLRPRLYLWRKETGPPSRKPQAKTESGTPPSPLDILPALSESKLADLAWSLDIKEQVSERE